MPVIVKTIVSPTQKTRRLMRATAHVVQKPAKKLRPDDVGYIETAARVIEIHYPTLPLARNLRDVAKQIGRL